MKSDYYMFQYAKPSTSRPLWRVPELLDFHALVTPVLSGNLFYSMAFNLSIKAQTFNFLMRCKEHKSLFTMYRKAGIRKEVVSNEI